MWIDKLARGVLKVETPIGARYIQPNFSERIYLLWIFRNFDSLPQQVLSSREQSLIDRLCAEQDFVPMSVVGEQMPVIGKIESRPPVLIEPMLPSRKPVAGAASGLPERGREAASA